jgi:hypothetical protein
VSVTAFVFSFSLSVVCVGSILTSIFPARIQLIERFYDPLAGEVYVSFLILLSRYWIEAQAISSSTANVSQILISRNTANIWRWCLKSLHSTLGLCASTSYWEQSNRIPRSHKRRLRTRVVTPIFSSLLKVSLSTCFSLIWLVWLELILAYRGFDTEVGGKGSQLSGGQKREFQVSYLR